MRWTWRWKCYPSFEDEWYGSVCSIGELSSCVGIMPHCFIRLLTASSNSPFFSPVSSLLPLYWTTVALPLDPAPRKFTNLPPKPRLPSQSRGRFTPDARLAVEDHLIVRLGFCPAKPLFKLGGGEEESVRCRRDWQILAAGDLAGGFELGWFPHVD